MSHEDQPVFSAGTKLEDASAATILIHGRGAGAQDILSLSTYLDRPGLAFLAPQAEGYTWYPNRFIFPIEQNEPYLSAALKTIDRIVREVEAKGITTDKIFIAGFSQGACLASEYVIRNPKRYGGLIAFSGGYIGPLNVPRTSGGDLEGMPAFLGCSDIDPHIPLQRVKETSALLSVMGASVNEKIYPDMGHTVTEDEIQQAKDLMQQSL
jgi:predicted esterase